MNRRRRLLRRVHLSHGTAVAYLALFVALGGSAYAAVTVTGKNVKNNSLTSADVRDRSLLGKDFKAGQLPDGEDGARGATGLRGPAGAQGATGPSGPGGGQGAAGAAGTAVAYARVLANGTVDAARSKGITSANVEKVNTQAGSYCFVDLPFAFDNVQVTMEVPTASPVNQIGLVGLPGNATTDTPCSFGGAPDYEVAVFTLEGSNTYADEAFFVTFN